MDYSRIAADVSRQLESGSMGHGRKRVRGVGEVDNEMPKTRTELLNHGRDGEVTLTAAPVEARGPMQLLPGQGGDGYGKKITLPWTVEYGGRTRRVYCTIISNAGTCWFMADGKKMIVG